MKKLLYVIPSILLIIAAIVLIMDYAALAKVQNNLTNITSNSSINLDSSLFTKEDSTKIVTQDPIDFEEDGFSQDLENDDIIFYSNIKTGAIRIYNKDTNYTWSSDVLDIDKYDLNNAGRRQLQSAFNLVYRDEKDAVKSVRTQESSITLTKKVEGNKVIFDIKESKSKIEFSYSIEIKNNKFTLLFDYNSIKEDTCRIISLTFFPYLGSAYMQEMPGYALLPSGSGALIRFDQEPTISSVYTSAFYGEDANLTINNEGDLLSLPIYGFVHGINQNALLVNIKSGSTFSKLNYSPSSIDKNFHMVYPTFYLRETYQLTFSSNSVLIIPENYYHHNIEIEYTILSNDQANYVGLAQDYQSTLVNEGILKKEEKDDDNISIDMEVFGRDYETGLILKKYYNMTKTKDILSFDEYLTSNNVSNIFYSLRAFNKKGYSNQSVSNYKFDKKLGNLKDLENLEAYFYYNPVESYNSSKKYPSKVLVNLYNEKNYIKVGVDKYKFYANVRSIEKYTNKALDYYDNIALDGIGYRLYGDHNNNLSKTDSLNVLTSILGDNKYVIYTPNYYFLKNTSKYLNIPLYCERLRFYTDSVPFLEILLRGYIDCYSPYLNFSSNEKVDVLKCIEYGVYPSYLVTKEESYNLADTLSSNYYATTFDNCKEAIVNNYRYINDALKQVIGCEITNRETLKLGVYKVTYSNSKVIVVNYTDDDYDYLGNTIASLEYGVF